jgi:flavin-dependent dehydrogenase
VDAREDVRVTSMLDDGAQSKRVQAITASGESLEWAARFVVDASGRDTFLASRQKWKQRNPKHASAAVFGHFSGITRRPSDDAGNISIYWFDHGWIWMIPLPDKLMSVGMVSYPQYLKTRQGSLDEFLRSTLDDIGEVRERLKNAAPAMPAQATGNYSYGASRSVGAGFMLIGDAYTFIDPVFSSGVYLAMSSAERATAVAEAWLNGSKLRYQLESRAYRRRLDRGIATFSWFIYRFTSPAMTELMSHPKNVLRVVHAVISMLAGDVYSNHSVRRRLWVFKVIYYFCCLSHWRGVQATRRARRAGVGLDPV